MNSHHCLVILIGNRFFYRYKNKKIFTAWCLAGAKLFQPCDNIEVDKIISVARKKGKKVEVIDVSTSELYMEPSFN